MSFSFLREHRAPFRFERFVWTMSGFVSSRVVPHSRFLSDTRREGKRVCGVASQCVSVLTSLFARRPSFSGSMLSRIRPRVGRERSPRSGGRRREKETAGTEALDNRWKRTDSFGISRNVVQRFVLDPAACEMSFAHDKCLRFRGS